MRKRPSPFRTVVTDERVSRVVPQQTLHAALRQLGEAWTVRRSPLFGGPADERIQWIYTYIREGR